MQKRTCTIALLFLTAAACGKTNNAGGDNDLGGYVIDSNGQSTNDDSAPQDHDTDQSTMETGDSDTNPTTDDRIVGIDPVHEGEADESIVAIEADDPDNPSSRAGITLSKESKTLPYLWAANHAQHSVSKFNTDTEEEEGRFWVGHNPSRTAVDLDGNAWIGGRDDGRLTKILWDSTTCPDRNGNGVIDTSSNVGGVIAKVNSQADPFADECVVYSDIPNTARTSIRGLAVAPDGKMWIGYSSGGVQSIDPHTFELGTFYPGESVPLYAPGPDDVLAETGQNVSSGGIYGLVIDAYGVLYTSSYTRNQMGVFDTNTEEWVGAYRKDGGCSYGIAIDASNRVWYGGYPGCGGVAMYDPEQHKFFTFAVPGNFSPTPKATVKAQVLTRGAAGGNGNFLTTGVAVEPATGDVWVSFYQIGYTGRLKVNENNYAESEWTMIATCRRDDNSFLPGVGADLRGVGFDHRGSVWTLGLNSDKVFKINPNNNNRDSTMPEGKPVGEGQHYTYSDFTGSTAFNFTAPRGYWNHVFTPPFECAFPVRIDVEAYVPAGTSLGTRIRPYDSSGNPTSDWIPSTGTDGFEYFDYPGQQALASFDISDREGLKGAVEYDVEVRFTTTNRNVRPILYALSVIWELDASCIPAVF